MVRIWIIFFVVSPILMMAQESFTEQAQTLGIKHLFSDISPTGGVSFCDFNHDGLDDLTFATDRDSSISFYLNMQDSFMKVDLGIENLELTMQVLWVDYDNDGDKDLYVTAYEGANRLYQNQGNLSFEDVTESSGLPLEDFLSYGACWGDYNRDGWLDLYVQERKGPLLANENRNRLYRNNADGTFSEVTDISNTADMGRKPFCAAFADFNNDKWPDLYIANDKLTVNTLLMNQGDGTFIDASISSGADLEMNAMCVTVGDYDADGWQDIYITNTEEGNKLLRNLGARDDVKFEEVAVPTGTEFLGIGWGSNFLDADNDGDLDLYVSGMDIGPDAVTSRLYQNNGSGNFSMVPTFAGDTVVSHSNALGDINNDGYADIAVCNFAPYPAQLWVNNANNNNWLKIELQGVLSNRDGIGSRIEVYHGSNYQQRTTFCGIGFLAQNSSTEIFGIGTTNVVDSIVITWPTGHRDKIVGITVNKKITVIEGSTTDGEIQVDPDIEQMSTATNSPSKKNPYNIKVFPNPHSDYLIIERDLPDPVNIEIHSLNGHLMYTKKSISIQRLQINTKSWISGTYVISFIDDRGYQITSLWNKIESN